MLSPAVSGCQARFPLNFRGFSLLIRTRRRVRSPCSKHRRVSRCSTGRYILKVIITFRGCQSRFRRNPGQNASKPTRRRQPHPRPCSILEGGGCAISEPVKDWTTRQKIRIWTRTEGETGRTIGQIDGQQATRAAGQNISSIDQPGGWQVNARWNKVTQNGGGNG